MTTMTVITVYPMTRFAESTVSVPEWLAKAADSDPASTSGCVEEFLGAVIAVSRAPHWKSIEGCEVRVGYNPNIDGHYFIFKQPNDGFAFIVGYETPQFPGNKGLPDPERMVFEV